MSAKKEKPTFSDAEVKAAKYFIELLTDKVFGPKLEFIFKHRKSLLN